MAEEKKLQAAPSKAVTAVKKEENAKVGFFKKIGNWFRGMKSELKKVIWPTPKQLTKNTVVSLVVMAVFAVVLWGFDEIAQFAVRLLFMLG